MTASLSSPTLAVWANVSGLPAPISVLIGLFTFVLVSLAWRILKTTNPSTAADNAATPTMLEAGGQSKTQASPSGVSGAGKIIGADSIYITSATWGIGGTACKDVTDVLRQNIVNGKIDVPVSKSLLGDPFQNEAKKLLVMYSVSRSRNFWIQLDEGKILQLPEKEGEEYSVKLGRDARQRLDTLLTAKDKVLDGVSDIEYKVFLSLERSFKNLPLSEKIALQRICEYGTLSSKALQSGMYSDGFSDPSLVIEQLLQKGFIEDNFGTLRAKDPKWIEVLQKENPIC